MSFIDKIVNSVRLNDEYDDNADFADDDAYEEEEESRRGFGERLREKREAKREQKKAERASRRRQAEEEAESLEQRYSYKDELDDLQEEVPDRSSYRKPGFAKKNREKARRPEETARWDTDGETSEETSYERAPEKPDRSKIHPFRRKSDQPMGVKVLCPASMEDSREIADTLMSETTVLLNLEGIDVDVAQRIIDFTCGTCYSLGGRLQKISNYIFILTPQDVDISGAVTDILGASFDIPTMRSQYS